MSTINTNVGAHGALRNLQSTNSHLDKTTNRVSTGRKVTGPADDASTFSIAQSLQGDLKSFDAVQQNLSSGNGIVGAAIAGATAVSDLLSDVKAKAIAASNPANTPEQQSILAADFGALVGQINTAVSNANYNGINLISAGSQSVSLTSTVTGGQLALPNASTVSGIPGALAGGVGTSAAALALLPTIDAQQVVVGDALGTLGATQKSLSFASTFSTTLSDAVTEGLGSLVDANLAAESAKLHALQVKQQLGGQTLGIANRRPQDLLSLFK